MNAFFWAILTACIWGVVPVLEKKGLVSVNPFVGLFYRSLGVFIGIVILGVFFVRPNEIKAVDHKSITYLVAGGFLASFVAQIAFYHGLKIGEVSKVVPISATYPLVAFILGYFILGESITLSKVFGMVLILAGIWLLKI